MRVLLLASWYKTPGSPVLGTFFEEQARMLLRRGIEVALLHPLLHPFGDRFSGGGERLPADVDDRGLPTLRAETFAPVPFSRALAVAALARKADEALLRHAARHGMPDVLHAHSVMHAGAVAARLSARHGIPWLLTEHLTALVVPGGLARLGDQLLARDVLRRAPRCLVVSSAFREDLAAVQDVPPHRLEVVPNVVAPEFFEDVAPPEEPGFVVFTSGFLVARKGHALLLRAFARLADRHPGALLRIGGDGPERAALERLATRLLPPGRVTFLGELSREAVRAELRRCHAFALASEYETFGVVLIEALAAGRPIVTTDSGGPRDVVAPGDGFLVQRGDEAALAAGLERIASGEMRPDASAISERCRARFSEAIVGARLETIYREMLRG